MVVLAGLEPVAVRRVSSNLTSGTNLTGTNMHRKIFTIKAVDYNAWCASAKHSDFTNNFEAAALFHSHENAEKAIHKMLQWKDSTFPYFSVYIDNNHIRYDHRDTLLNLRVVAYDLVLSGSTKP